VGNRKSNYVYGGKAFVLMRIVANFHGSLEAAILMTTKLRWQKARL
jgi:hypothetical protein